MATQYSITPGGAFPGSQVSIDNTRRKYQLGDGVNKLDPRRQPFQVFLNKIAKKPTNDPVFKFLEQRQAYTRRYVYANTGQTITADADGYFTVTVHTLIDEYGREQSTNQKALFVLAGQILRLKGGIDTDGTGGADSTGVMNAKVHSVTQNASDTDIKIELLNPVATVTASTSDFIPTADLKWNIVGSAFGEATDTPDAWSDLSLYPSEGFTQIVKTACPMMSGTGMATEYRGIKNEFKRIWTTKTIEHRTDLENAALFGVGSADESASGGPGRRTWGIVPYTEANGKVYKVEWDVTYGNETAGYYSGDYDGFLRIMEDFFDPERGNSGDKLVLASRSVITWLNSLNSNSFLGNTLGTSSYQLDVQNIKHAFGFMMTRVNTIHGNIHVVQEPLFRGVNDNMMAMIDLRNIAWRPLQGNGVSRDTYIETNVQNPGVDGRQDQIITEAGLQIDLAETHAIVKFGDQGSI